MTLPRLLLALTLLAGRAAADPALATDQPVGHLEVVATLDGPIVTGLAVTPSGRIFVCFPRWSDPVTFTVGEIVGGRVSAYPDQAINDASRPTRDRLVSVQSVVADDAGHLWILDSGCLNQGPVLRDGPKLVEVDLPTNRVIRTILFPRAVATEHSYMNDVRFAPKLGRAGFAFLTDSSVKSGDGLIAVDLATGESWRRLVGDRSVLPEPGFFPLVEGQPLFERPATGPEKPFLSGSDGLAVSPDSLRVWYAPLSGRRLYSVDASALADRARSDADVAATIVDHGDKGTACDGMETDDQGRLYIASAEHDAILRRNADGRYETLVHDPRILWPDSMAIAGGYLYFTANQLDRMPRFHRGQDLRQKPWVIFRVKIDAGPYLPVAPQGGG